MTRVGRDDDVRRVIRCRNPKSWIYASFVIAGYQFEDRDLTP